MDFYVYRTKFFDSRIKNPLEHNPSGISLCELQS